MRDLIFFQISQISLEIGKHGIIGKTTLRQIHGPHKKPDQLIIRDR